VVRLGFGLMPTNQNGDDEKIPKLQLQYSGGGPGSKVRTAVGASSGDNYISGARLPNPPWWFFVFEKKQKDLCRANYHQMPIAEALASLERAGVPPISRLAVGLEWAFIDPNEDGFSRQDLKELIVGAELGIDPWVQWKMRSAADTPGFVETLFDLQLQFIEAAVVYRLWQYERQVPKDKAT
jgi:hypothetical protein